MASIAGQPFNSERTCNVVLPTSALAYDPGMAHSDNATEAATDAFRGYCDSIDVQGFMIIPLGVLGCTMDVISFFVFVKLQLRSKSIGLLLVSLSIVDGLRCFFLFAWIFLMRLACHLVLNGHDSLGKLLTGTSILMFQATFCFEVMSVFILLAITADRYLAICHPLLVYKHCTRTRAKITIIVSSIVGFIYAVSFLWNEFLTTFFQFVPIVSNDKVLLRKLISLMDAMLFAGLPTILLIIVDTKVALTIRRVRLLRKALTTSQQTNQDTAKMMVYIVQVYLLFAIPSLVVRILQVFDVTIAVFDVMVEDVCRVLSLLYSTTTFCIYCKYSTRFRRKLLQQYSFKSAGNRRQSDGQPSLYAMTAPQIETS